VKRCCSPNSRISVTRCIDRHDTFANGGGIFANGQTPRTTAIPVISGAQYHRLERRTRGAPNRTRTAVAPNPRRWPSRRRSTSPLQSPDTVGGGAVTVIQSGYAA